MGGASAATLRTLAHTAAHIHLAHIGVAPAHHAGHLLVALLLPGFDRVSLAPGLIELAILLRQAQLVAVGHIEVGACDHSADRRARHHLARLEIHYRLALPVLMRFLRQPGEAVVAAVAIHLADARHQVVQVGFGLAELRIVGRAVLAAAFLPALALMADHPGRDDMKCAKKIVTDFLACAQSGIYVGSMRWRMPEWNWSTRMRISK